MAQDYYQILGVDKNASKEDIKKAYKKLSKRYHPDMEDGDEDMFKKISEAFEVLTDDKKRNNYDKFGDAKGPAPGGGFQQKKGGPGMGDSFFDMFNRHKKKQQKQSSKGNDLKAEVEVDIKQIFDRASKKISYTRKKPCDECGGKGGKGGSGSCKTCGGSGFISQARRTPLGVLEQYHECLDCGGNGESFKNECPSCRGGKEVKSTEEVDVELKPNLVDGDTLIYKQKGNFNRGASISGDLVVVIRERPHKEFYREDGHNIGKVVELNYEDFVLGKNDFQVTTISDKKINVKVPEQVDPDQKLRIKGEGMPKDEKGHNKGDMLLKLKIKVPKNVSDEEKELLRKVRDGRPDQDTVDSS